MSFQSQNEAAFAAAVNIFRSNNPGSCTMRLPVNKDGTDAPLGVPGYPYASANYDCIQAPSPDTMTLVTGGMHNDYKFSISCLKTDFQTPPISGTLFIRNGRVSRILVVQDGGQYVDVSPILYLHCGDPDS